MSEEILSKIYAYLELDSVTDNRLKLKSDLMKKIIYLMSTWKEGTENEWIDKLATRCSLSTRKIRENYLKPLITEGIVAWEGNGHIRFVGIPDNAVMPCELTPEQLKQELEEENEQRNMLGKPKVSEEDWRKSRSKRLKPLS
jgi:hypothetical protein